jgi:predicted kinase
VLWLAQRFKRPAIAIVFGLPLELCIARDLARPNRQVGAEVIRDQWEQMPKSPSVVAEEGFGAVYWFTAPAEVDSARVAFR